MLYKEIPKRPKLTYEEFLEKKQQFLDVLFWERVLRSNYRVSLSPEEGEEREEQKRIKRKQTRKENEIGREEQNYMKTVRMEQRKVPSDTWLPHKRVGPYPNARRKIKRTKLQSLLQLYGAQPASI